MAQRVLTIRHTCMPTTKEALIAGRKRRVTRQAPTPAQPRTTKSARPPAPTPGNSLNAASSQNYDKLVALRASLRRRVWSLAGNELELLRQLEDLPESQPAANKHPKVSDELHNSTWAKFTKRLNALINQAHARCGR